LKPGIGQVALTKTAINNFRMVEPEAVNHQAGKSILDEFKARAGTIRQEAPMFQQTRL
jgi:hypothetical protein